MKPSLPLLCLLLAAAQGSAQVDSSATAPFPGFESGPARPILLSASGTRLYLLNTADGRLEIYKSPAMVHLNSVFTGLEPVSMYAFIPQSVKCVTCHKGDLAAQANFTGAQRTVNFDGPEELFNAPTLRSAYEKEFKDLLGFGLTNTGEKESIRAFLDTVLQVGGGDAFQLHTPQIRDDVAEFVRQWDTGISALAGQQFTWKPGLDAEANAFLGLAETQAQAANVDLIFHGWFLLPNGTRQRHGADPADPDSDDDGFDDGLEVALGSNPARFDATVGDTQVPVIDPASVDPNHFSFVDTATVHFQVSEPAAVLVEYGTSPGSYTLGSVAVSALRRTHDVILSGLPAGTLIFYRVIASDHSGNVAAPYEGQFRTKPPICHVGSITAAVSGCEVNGFWHSDTGDLGGQAPGQAVNTDPAGSAVFTLGPCTPAAATAVTFTVLFVGSVNPADPFFVGNGGQTPAFFYFQPDNKQDFATVPLN